MEAKRVLPSTRTLSAVRVLGGKTNANEHPFIIGELNSYAFRVPAGVYLDNQDILALTSLYYYELSDYTHTDYAQSRSRDGGKTWGEKKVSIQSRTSYSRMVNPTIIYDKGKIIIMMTELFSQDGKVWWSQPDTMWDTYIYTSTDNGVNWSKVSIKQNLIGARQQNYGVIMGGLGTGVVMPDGLYVFPIEIGYNSGSTSRIENALAYSYDLKDWQISNSLGINGDEANIVLLDDKTILMNARNYGSRDPKYRKIYTTQNLGETWTPHATNNTIPESRATMGHTLKVNLKGSDYVLFSHMGSTTGIREDLTLSVLNNAKTKWNKVSLILGERYDGYSWILWNDRDPDKLFLIYEQASTIYCRDISDLIPTIIEQAKL